MGLLDQLSAGLLGGDSPSADLGMGILAANQPSPVRQPFGGILAQGVSGARQQAMAAQELKKRAMELQMQQFQMQQFQQNYPQWAQMLSQRLGGGQPGTPQAAAQAAGIPQDGSGSGGGGGQGGPGGAPQASAPPGAPPTQQAPQQAPQQLQGPQGSGWNDMNTGMLGSVLGMPGAAQLSDMGKTELQYDPRVAQQMEAAKSPIAIDLYNRNAAIAAGDKQAAAAWHQKFLTDSKLLNISERNGNVTAFTGGVDSTGLPNFSGFNPDKGIRSTNSGAQLIPGYAGAEGAIAGAKAWGEAGAKPASVIDGSGNQYTAPLATVLRGQPNGQPYQSALGPAAAAVTGAQGNQAAEINKEFQNKAEAGNAMLTQVATLRNAANDFTPGQYANSRMGMLNFLNSSGLITKEQASSLGSAQEGQKIAIQLQAAATKQLGSREAAQIFSIMGKSLPNLTMSQNGLEKVSAYMEGISRYDIARASKAEDLFNKQDANGINQVRGQFITNSNPLYYIVASAKPDIQREMIQSMGARAPDFLKSWNAAANAGWAPRPSQYWGANGGP